MKVYLNRNMNGNGTLGLGMIGMIILMSFLIILNNQSSFHVRGQTNNETMTTCFNVSSNETDVVCSGNGNCIGLDNCSCSEGYYGLMCEQGECFGVRTSIEWVNQNGSICSGHGYCVSYNNCSCVDGFNGSNCEVVVSTNVAPSNASSISQNETSPSNVTSATTSSNETLANSTVTNSTSFSNTTTSSNETTTNTTVTNSTSSTFNNTSTINNETLTNNSTNNTASIDSNTVLNSTISANSTTNFTSTNLENNSNVTNVTSTEVSNNQTITSNSTSNVTSTTPNLNETTTNTTVLTNSTSSFNETSDPTNSTTSNPENPTIEEPEEPADNRTVIDALAGYRIISDISICCKSLSQAHSTLGASVVTEFFSRCDSTTKSYEANGSAIITPPSTKAGARLFNEMDKRMGEILSLPCNYTVSNILGQNTFIARHGGVYCFDSKIVGLTNPTFVIIGSERVVFRLKTTIITNPKYVHLEGSSYRNFFMVMEASVISAILGDIDATVISYKTFLGAGRANSTLTGAIWSKGQTMTLTDMVIAPPLTFDKYEQVLPTNYYTMCYGTVSTSPQTCSGKGKCIDYNTCSCNIGWFGNNCSISKCVPIPSCSNHGCIEDEACKCFSDPIRGYWNGLNCSTCQDGYFGSLCSTKFGSSSMVSSDFRGLVFNLYLPDSFKSIEFPCSNLISSADLQSGLFGLSSNVKCKYIDRANSLFMISFGSIDYTLQPGTSVSLNSLVYDSIASGSLKESYLSIPVNYIQNVDPPVSVITMPSSLSFGSCEEIVIDGSSSRSLDGKTLKYYWTLINSQNNQLVSNNFPNEPFVRLNASLSAGSYKMSLFVASKFLNMNSSVVYSSVFTKSNQPLPTLSVVSSVQKLTTEFPITIKKTISESTCQSETSTITWTQLSGPSINYKLDEYNNLLITSLTSYGASSYVFKVSASYPSNPTESVSAQVTFTTSSPDLTLSIVQVNVQEKYTTLLVDYSDPESILNTGKTETWKWTSTNTNSNLTNLLNSISNDKSTSVTIQSSLFETIPDSIDLTLRITKSDARTIEKSTTIYFTNIPPVINIINSDTSTPSAIVAGEPMPIQTFIPSSKDTNITWSVNGVEQGSTTETTTTISIDTSNLEEGSNNTVTIVATTIGSGTARSTSVATSYSTDIQFVVAETPKPCDCTISPLAGVALQTDFDFYCTNCKNKEKHIDYKYGFVDDRSGVKIYLYNLEEVFSTKLPLPYKGNTLNCFFEIVDTSTGAFTASNFKVNIQAPSVAKVEDVQTMAKTWTQIATSYLQKGDFAKTIYQLASVSRINSILLKSAMSKSSRLVSATDCANGSLENGICYCQDGYYGDSCDKVVSDFSNIQLIQTKLIETLISVANKTLDLNSDFMSLFVSASDSMMVNFEYLESSTVSKSIQSLNQFLNGAMSNTDFKLGSGADSLLNSYINSAYNYILQRQPILDETKNGVELLKLIKVTSSLKGRSLYIGKSTKQTMSGTFFSSILGRNLLNDYANTVRDSKTGAAITIQSGFFDMTNLFSSVFKKPFIFALTVTDDIYSWQRTLAKKKSTGLATSEQSNIISPIVSFDVADVLAPTDYSKVIYSIPINGTISTEKKITTSGLSIQQSESSYSCADFQDGATELSTSCNLISITSTVATCQCSKRTNVFIRETVSVSQFTLTYGVALIAVFVSLFVLCILVVGIVIVACCTCRIVKKQKQSKHEGKEEVKTKKPHKKSQIAPGTMVELEESKKH